MKRGEIIFVYDASVEKQYVAPREICQVFFHGISGRPLLKVETIDITYSKISAPCPYSQKRIIFYDLHPYTPVFSFSSNLSEFYPSLNFRDSSIVTYIDENSTVSSNEQNVPFSNIEFP